MCVTVRVAYNANAPVVTKFKIIGNSHKVAVTGLDIESTRLCIIFVNTFCTILYGINFDMC